MRFVHDFSNFTDVPYSNLNTVQESLIPVLTEVASFKFIQFALTLFAQVQVCSLDV